MDTFGEIINDITRTAIENGSSDFYVKDGIKHCSICNKPLEIIREVFGQTRSLPVMCDCQREQERILREQKHLQELEDARRRCFQGEYSRLSKARLSDCFLEHPKEAGMVQRYVKHFREFYAEQKGLLFYGKNGTGKSYMAAALCNALIDGGHDVCFTTFSRIESQSFVSSKTDRRTYLDSLMDYALLVLDDLGAERSSEYMQELVFSVIDSRYESGKPMCITTNLTMQELKNPQTAQQSRIYDRILQICHPIPLLGESIRRKETKTRYYETKAILEGEEIVEIQHKTDSVQKE